MEGSSSALRMVQVKDTVLIVGVFIWNLSLGVRKVYFPTGNFPVLLDFYGNKTENRRQFPLFCLWETFQGVFLSGWCKAVVIPKF